jgi:Conjugal transfer protein
VKKIIIIIIALLLALYTDYAAARTRTIVVSTDQVADVRTALGIATKVLLEENPTNSPIIGDMGAFRIEAIDKGYAIKPLRYGAKTNFFITTKDRSYIVRLTTVLQDQADYVVYLVPKNSDQLEMSVQYKNYKKIKKENELILILKRIGKTSDGFIIFEFSLNSATEEKASFEKFKIKQGKSYKTIHNLILSHRWMTPDRPISGWMTVRLDDLDRGLPLTIEMQTSKQNRYLKLEIPKELLWKN